MSDFNGEDGWRIEVADGLIREVWYHLGHVHPLGHDQAGLEKSDYLLYRRSFVQTQCFVQSKHNFVKHFHGGHKFYKNSSDVRQRCVADLHAYCTE